MSPVTMFTAFAFLQVLTSGGFAAKLFLHQVCVINGEELACAFTGEGMYSVAANMAKDYEGVTRVVFAERFQNCVLDCSYLNLLTHLEYGISPFDTLDRCQHLSNNVRAVTVVSGRRTRMCPASPEVISTAAPATPRSSSAVPDTSSAAPATPRSSSAVPDISTAVPATSGLSGMIDDFKAARCAESCKDIYKGLANTASGLYTIYSSSGVQATVFCDFYDGRGYTYIAKADLGNFPDFSDLYTQSHHALLKINYKNGEQHVVSLAQLSSHEDQYSLSLQSSKHDGYKAPRNAALGPYIYVGFLPIEVAAIKSSIVPPTQGYRPGGKDQVFTNCDKNPDGYITLLANAGNQLENPYWQTCCDNAFMRKWLTGAQLLPTTRYMTAEFYYQFEMHMGGCGGYLTSKHVEKNGVTGVALGFGFEI